MKIDIKYLSIVNRRWTRKERKYSSSMTIKTYAT